MSATDYEQVTSTRQLMKAERVLSIKRVVYRGLEETENVWDLFSLFDTGIDATYREMTFLERARLISTELILAALYIGVLGWFVSGHLDHLIPAWQTAAAWLMPTALAQPQTIQSSPNSIKITIMTTYAIMVIVVLLMSAYSALLRKPPLQAAKDVLKLTLSFATGQIIAAGFLM